MRSPLLIALVALVAAVCPPTFAEASIFLPGRSSARSLADFGVSDSSFHRSRSQQRAVSKQRRTVNVQNARRHLAMAIPGNGLVEQVMVGGFGNFIAIYNTVITARILLSWFPQAQGVAVLQPVYQITDPYLNLFRGIIPPVFGLDLSPILAFVTLDLLRSSTVSLAAEIPSDLKQKLEKGNYFGTAVRRGRHRMSM